LTKENHRAEHRIGGAADDQLLRMRALQHGLHCEAMDYRGRLLPLDAR
jgi:hypothetical protein